jgi:hypothetical protein
MSDQVLVSFLSIWHNALATKHTAFVFNGHRYRIEPDRDRPGHHWAVLIA